MTKRYLARSQKRARAAFWRNVGICAAFIIGTPIAVFVAACFGLMLGAGIN